MACTFSRRLALRWVFWRWNPRFPGISVACFGWLAVALFVDAADGPMARRLNVIETASRYDGSVLDLVVDFITYVFVPAAILLRPEIMPQPYGLAMGLIITIGSALYFADTKMKTHDCGVPRLPRRVERGGLLYRHLPAAGMAGAGDRRGPHGDDVPAAVVFVHPVRVKRWRPMTMVGARVVGAWPPVWSIIVDRLAPGVLAKGVLLIGGIYFLGLGFLRDLPEKE